MVTAVTYSNCMCGDTKNMNWDTVCCSGHLRTKWCGGCKDPRGRKWRKDGGNTPWRASLQVFFVRYQQADQVKKNAMAASGLIKNAHKILDKKA